MAASHLAAQPVTAPSTPALADKSLLLRGTLSVLGPCDASPLLCECADGPAGNAGIATTTAGPVSHLPGAWPATSQWRSDASNRPPVFRRLHRPALITEVTRYSGPSLPPVFPSQPLKPIPEASTWVMTIIGFSIMAFAFGKKRRSRINPISIIDIAEN